MTAMQGRGRRPIGFTLVELLVVIVIITALAAILVPAVYFVVGKAKQSRIAIEVTNLSHALERYRQEFGEYPPDFASAAIMTNQEQRREEARRLIDEHLSSIHRRRVQKNLNPQHPNYRIYDLARTDTPSPPAPPEVDESILDILDPSNALVFWLQGFSPDPQFPISGSGERSPLMDFDKGRFKNEIQRLTLDRQARTYAAQYVPNDGGGDQPYLYYCGRSYTSQVPVTDPNVLPAVAWANNISSTNPLGVVSPPYVSSVLGNNFVDPEKYQIICAGLDGDYGTVKVPQEVTFEQAIQNILNYPSLPDGKNCEKPHKDNITSFSGGVLADLWKS